MAMTPVVDSPFVRRVLVALALVSGTVLLALLAWCGLSALMVTFAGLLLAVLLRTMVQLLQRWTGLGDRAALALAGGLLLVIGAGGLVLLWSPLQEQGAEMYDALPRAIEQLEGQVRELPLGERLLSRFDAPDALPTIDGTTARRVVSIASWVATALGHLIFIGFLGLFLAAEPALYRRGLVRLAPMALRARLDAVLCEVGDQLQRWLVARLALMLVVTAATWVGLLLLGVPLALALAVLAGLLNFIPNFGPIISAVPAMLLALLQDPMKAVWVAVLYLVIQTVESYTLEPYALRKADDLPPALVIASQLFLGVTLGAAGLVLATPLLVVVDVLVRRLYVEDALGDVLEGPQERGATSPAPSLTTASLDRHTR
jgi:predicted PurR-regulated permease PerM